MIKPVVYLVDLLKFKLQPQTSMDRLLTFFCFKINVFLKLMNTRQTNCQSRNREMKR